MNHSFQPPSAQAPHYGLICFEISGDAIGQCITCVSAVNIEAARARVEPLFKGCRLTPVCEETRQRS